MPSEAKDSSKKAIIFVGSTKVTDLATDWQDSVLNVLADEQKVVRTESLPIVFFRS